MCKILRCISILAAALMLVSLCVFADEDTEGKAKAGAGTDKISFESGTDNAADTALKGIEIHHDESFDEADLRRCKEVIGLVLAGETQDLDVRSFSGLEPVSIGDSVTVYRDGKFIYIAADPSPGMNQLYGYELISRDRGLSWQLNHFHRVMDPGDMYIINGNIMYIDGIGMQTIAEPVISADFGKSYVKTDTGAIEKIMSLPSMEACYCYAKVKEIDVDQKRIVFNWFMNSSESAESINLFYRTTAPYPSFKKAGGEDLSGLLKTAEQYCKTGYLFEKSGSEKLDKIELSSRFLKEYRLAGAEKTAREIRLAVNEIYARKGQDFKDDNIREYFESKKWYKPEPGKTVEEKELNEAEAYNVSILQELKKEYEALFNE